MMYGMSPPILNSIRDCCMSEPKHNILIRYFAFFLMLLEEGRGVWAHGIAGDEGERA
jgi:hypothetical protein